jgi:hypothetical protein
METSHITPDHVEALRIIASGGVALSAAIEYELEDLGLIVQTDAPYATLTPEGEALCS